MRTGGRQRDLDEITSRVENTFSALASTALRESRGDFIALAEQQLGKLNEKALGDFETRRVAVEKIIEPLTEAIERYRLERERLEQQRLKDVGRLDGQYTDLASTTARLQAETSKLVNALRSPHVRGSWGQLTLRRTAELAGMVRYCDFFEQESIHGDDGRSTPDMLVRLPRQRLIVIDSKAPLDAYLNALETTNDADRERFLAGHAAQTRDHIVRLGSKEYHRQFTESPEFVVAFFPNDSVLAAAAAHDPDLVEFALVRNVVIATPASLFALLRAVEHGWRQDQLAENSRMISVLGQQLADRLAVMIDHFDRLGGALRRAVETYNETVGSLESRVLPAARRFKHLGAQTRDLAELMQVDIAPRSVSVRGPFEGAQEIFPNEDDLGSGAELVASDDASPSLPARDVPVAEEDIGGTEPSVGPASRERIPPGGSRA